MHVGGIIKFHYFWNGHFLSYTFVWLFGFFQVYPRYINLIYYVLSSRNESRYSSFPLLDYKTTLLNIIIMSLLTFEGRHFLMKTSCHFWIYGRYSGTTCKARTIAAIDNYHTNFAWAVYGDGMHFISIINSNWINRLKLMRFGVLLNCILYHILI